jgi:hypothetical protein
MVVLISELGIVSSSSRGRVDFQSISVEICVTTVSNTTYLPCRSPYTTMYVPLRTSIRFSSCGAHYGVMNPQRVLGAGIEPALPSRNSILSATCLPVPPSEHLRMRIPLCCLDCFTHLLLSHYFYCNQFHTKRLFSLPFSREQHNILSSFSYHKHKQNKEY